MAWTGQANQMKAELERTCPAHGFRRVRIFTMRRLPPLSGPESKKERIHRENAELDQVIEDYEARESAWVRAHPDCPTLDELVERHFKR
jgi:hypothetical protein